MSLFKSLLNWNISINLLDASRQQFMGYFICRSTAKRDRADGKIAFGFGIVVDSVREARFVVLYLNSFFLRTWCKWNHRIHLIFVCSACSYHRADPNFVMLKPNKEHLAEGIQWKIGERPLFESDLKSGKFDGIPKELRPLDKIM